MPPRKDKTATGEPTKPTPERTPGPRRVPDYFDGDRSGLDNLLRLDKMSVTRPKGVLFCTLQLVQSLDDVPVTSWPAWLQPAAPALLAAVASEKRTSKGEETRNVDVRAKLTLAVGETQLGLFTDRTVRLWKVKTLAKPGESEIRWYLQITGEWVEDLGRELFTLLGSTCAFETEPVQQSLTTKKRPTGTASELPPEAGDELVQ